MCIQYSSNFCVFGLTIFFFLLKCTASIALGEHETLSLSKNTWVSFSNQRYSPAFNGCEKNLIPPDTRKNGIPKYVINLNLPPQDRWTEVVQDKRNEILELLETVRESSDEWFGRKLFNLVNEYLPSLARTLPKSYFQEIEGMASAINVTVGEATLFNVFYEFFSVCTSIISHTPDGQIYHARNMDFGLFLGWDIKNQTWLTTEKLRPLVVELDFQKDKKTIFKSVSFAGFLGVLTGMKPNAFTLTINERFKLNGGFIGVVEWIFGKHNQQWVGYFTRTVMESANTYIEAQKMLAKAPLVSPVYFILAGIKPFQGCIITRGRNNFDIKGITPNGSDYIVQTNYDHWTSPPFYDDRRTPAQFCLESLGLNKPKPALYNVLSTKPVLNKLTVYTTIMQASSASMDTWLQDCSDPCWPW